MKRTKAFCTFCFLIVLITACQPVPGAPANPLPGVTGTLPEHPSLTAGFQTPSPNARLSETPASSQTLAVSSTPFSTATSLPVPTGIGNCPATPAAVIPPDEAVLPGKIYMWQLIGPTIPNYIYHDPLLGDDNPNELHAVDPAVADPFQAFAFAFSNYSQRLAYLTKNEATGRVELWMADLPLCNVELLWEDVDYWFGDYSRIKTSGGLKVHWGPGDQSILISLHESNHALIYSLNTGESLLWSGACDWIVRSPASGRLALGCLPGEAAGSDAWTLEVDGAVQSGPPPEKDRLVQVLDWSFSPDGSRVLFANAVPYQVKKVGTYDIKFFKIGVMEQDGSLLELPITWSNFLIEDNFYGYYNPKRGLQWSQDGSKLLAIGFENANENEFCPPGDPCWFVFDARSGTIQWYLTNEAAGYSLEKWNSNEANAEVQFLQEATLSPDGEWIAIFSQFAQFKHFDVFSLSTNQRIRLGFYNQTNLYWAK